MEVTALSGTDCSRVAHSNSVQTLMTISLAVQLALCCVTYTQRKACLPRAGHSRSRQEGILGRGSRVNTPPPPLAMSATPTVSGLQYA
jgi:hypothetical protein